MSDELTFLIYKVGQKDKTNEKMRDLSKVLVRLISILKENEGLELHRIQAMLRQLNIPYTFIEKFFKHLYYSYEMHNKIFQ